MEMHLISKGRECMEAEATVSVLLPPPVPISSFVRSFVRSFLPCINLDFNLIAALLSALSPSPFLIPVLSPRSRFLARFFLLLPSSETVPQMLKLNIICDVRVDINPLKRRR